MATGRPSRERWPGSVRRSRQAARRWRTGKACVTGKHFVDSNILIYAHDADAGERPRRAAKVLAGC